MLIIQFQLVLLKKSVSICISRSEMTLAKIRVSIPLQLVFIWNSALRRVTKNIYLICLWFANSASLILGYMIQQTWYSPTDILRYTVLFVCVLHCFSSNEQLTIHVQVIVVGKPWGFPPSSATLYKNSTCSLKLICLIL